MALNIVMGVSGRTHFIKEHFPDWKHFLVGDYQKNLFADMGNPKSIEFHAHMEVLINIAPYILFLIHHLDDPRGVCSIV